MISTTVISHLRWLSPLWCLTAPPSPRGIGRATKGKRLYGQARRLTSPDLHILCRMCTVDNKALKSSPFISRTTISTGYSSPTCGGSPAKRARGNVFPRPQGGCEGFIQNGAFYNLEAPSTTLSGIAAVKLKNPRGHSPVKLYNPQARQGLSISPIKKAALRQQVDGN